MTQKDADTTDVNCTPPLVKVSGVVSVTSSQQALWRLADIEQTSFRVVSMGPPKAAAVAAVELPPPVGVSLRLSAGKMAFTSGGGVREEKPGKKTFHVCRVAQS